VPASRLAGVLVAAALLSAACGTTVPLADSQVVGAGGTGLGAGPATGPNDGLGAGDPGAPAGLPIGSGGTAGPAAGSVERGTTTGAGGGPSARPDGAAPTTRAPGGPVARGPIRLGAVTATGAARYQQTLGVSGATGDQIALTRAVVDHINARGGIGGRRIDLLVYDVDAAAFSANASTTMQEACTYFTQDNEVSAVASLVALVPESFYACLAKARLPVVTVSEGSSADLFARYPDSLYAPSAPNYTRLLADSVDALWEAGWLTAGSRVGVVGYDTRNSRDVVDKGLVPALKRRGLTLAADLFTSDDTSAASEYNGGVLKFKTQGVDRVFFAPGGQPYYFALAASSQDYRPRYALGSLEYPTTLAANLPAEQLSGAMGLGWSPYFDLPSSAWASVSTPGIAECRTAMASARQDFSSGTTLGIASWICDEWFFLRDVLASAGGTDAQSFRRAAEALGEAFRPASTFRTRLSPGRTHDGAAAYRLVAFDDSCECFRYTSGVRPLL
jgi:ABC-type branched-subunit amino acid transport system substrate-binding protein